MLLSGAGESAAGDESEGEGTLAGGTGGDREETPRDSATPPDHQHRQDQLTATD